MTPPYADRNVNHPISRCRCHRHEQMGHHWGSDLVCINVGCEQTWAWQQSSLTNCQGEKNSARAAALEKVDYP
jgi:hypothetical protein